jgi:hypothetical protein
MAAFNFPDNPSNGDTHTENGVTFEYNGNVWKRSATTGAQGATGATGAQGAAGPSNSITVSATTDSTSFPVLVSESGAGTRTPLVGNQFTFDESTGNLTCAGTVTANSDVNLKKNVTTIDNALDKVLNLRGVEFDFKKNDAHSIGFIAQEVENVLPELVFGSDPKSVAYQNVVALLVEAVKEQNDIINNLKKRIENLEDNN